MADRTIVLPLLGLLAALCWAAHGHRRRPLRHRLLAAAGAGRAGRRAEPARDRRRRRPDPGRENLSGWAPHRLRDRAGPAGLGDYAVISLMATEQ